MKGSKAIALMIVVLLAMFLYACGGGGGGGGGVNGTSSTGTGTGTLSIGLTDTSTTRYSAIYVTIDEVQVNKKSSSSGRNSGWTVVARPEQTYNLLSLINGLTAVLGDKELEAGKYRQVRLIIGKHPESENNLLGIPHPYANYVILNDGSDTIERLKIPSGFQTGIKLVHNFMVLTNTVVELVLDFDACRSVVETGNGKYILKPTIKVIETDNKSTVYGDVTESVSMLPITGALVSAQISKGLSATVIRSTLTSDEVGYEGEYSLILSPGQAYNIVAYSDQKVGTGLGEMYSPVCSTVTVPENGDTRLDFTFSKTDFGTIAGEVFVSGKIDPDNPPVVYVNFYRMLNCGYVEIVSIPMSPDPIAQMFSFSTDLPLGIYDVVASSQGFLPDTAPSLDLSASGDVVHVKLNLLEK
jgi:hypothetical protein